MRRAAADRAEETQTRFTSSKLLPADQFLRNPPKEGNYLEQKKGAGGGEVDVMQSENVFRKNWVVSLGLNLFSMCQRQQWTHCLGFKLTSEELFKEEWFRPSIRSRPEARWLKNRPPETHCSYITTCTGPTLLSWWSLSQWRALKIAVAVAFI